jgi:hypothetical protein
MARLYILTGMPELNKTQFSSVARRYLFWTCLAVLMVFVVQLSTGLAFSRAESSSATSLQSCPSVEEEIVDLQILADGLKKSRAVGFFEKLSLKSSIDDLLRRFQNYHAGSGNFTLEELQQQYDILLMRIAAHLQHQDVLLHQQLCNAWDIIWEDLSNPDRFSEKFS